MQLDRLLEMIEPQQKLIAHYQKGLAVIQGVLEQPNGCHRYVDGFHAKDCPGCDLLATVRHVRQSQVLEKGAE